MKITKEQKRVFHNLNDTELDKLGLTKYQVAALMDSDRWSEVVEAHRGFIMSIKKLVPATVAVVPTSMARNQTQFKLTVNYDQSIEDARRAGEYDLESAAITSKNFPTTRKGTVNIDLCLASIDREISSEEMIAGLSKKGLRPAETHELLALGAAHPELQREFPIIALGSVWQDNAGGNCLVPYLHHEGFKRKLCLAWIKRMWTPRYRIAAVCR